MENDNLSEIIYMLADALNDFADNVSRLQTNSNPTTAVQFCLV